MNRGIWAAAGLVVLSLAGCGSASTTRVTVTSGSGATSSTQTTVATPPATTSSTNGSPPPLHLTTFRSPSGNIGCGIVAGLARCDIQHRSWSPGPRPASCPHIVDYGQGLEVAGAGVGRLVCAGDTVMVPSAPKLPYGRSTSVGSFRCASSTSGITCRNADSGHGFFLSIQSYRAF
jgi:hypothetical protein